MDNSSPSWQVSLWHILEAAVVGTGAFLFTRVRRALREKHEEHDRMLERMREFEERTQTMCEATRRCADGVRQTIWVLRRPDRIQDEVVDDSLAVLGRDMDEIREELWLLGGHESRKVKSWAKRTQPILVGEGEE